MTPRIKTLLAASVAFLAAAGATCWAKARKHTQETAPHPGLPTEQPHAAQPPTPEPEQERAPVANPQKKGGSRGNLATQLLDALTVARPLLGKRSHFPILECCLLAPGQVTVTDLDTFLTLQVPALQVSPVCVNGRRLREALRLIKGDLSLRLDGEMLVLNHEQVRLPTHPVTEFPVPPTGEHQFEEGPSFSLPVRFADVLAAMARDESRPQLHGVCIDLKRGAVVASDGHRLHVVEAETAAWEKPHTVPAPAARILAQVAPQGVTGTVLWRARPTANGAETPNEEVLLRFTAPGLELVTRAVEVAFPDYAQVIDGTRMNRHTMTLPVAELRDALKMAVAYGPKKTLCSVSLTRVAEGVRVRLESSADGTMEQVIPAQGWVQKRYVGIQAAYLLDIVNAVGSESMTLHIKNATAPLRVQDGDFTAVVMPVRIEPCPDDMEDEPTSVPVNGSHTAGAPQSA